MSNDDVWNLAKSFGFEPNYSCKFGTFSNEQLEAYTAAIREAALRESAELCTQLYSLEDGTWGSAALTCSKAILAKIPNQGMRDE